MNRYQAMCVAIELCQSARKIFGKEPEGKETANEIIQELQEVARDVRYGGKWVGDYEDIAQCMEKCAETDCTQCPYRTLQGNGCRSKAKKVAAAVIRQLEYELKEKEEKIRTLERQMKDTSGDADDTVVLFESQISTCSCKNTVNRYFHPKFCGYCGKELMWY